MKKKRSAIAVIVVTILLIVIMMMNAMMLYRQTRNTTLDSGTYQLLAVSGELENTINEAALLTLQLGVECREYIEDKDALGQFIVNKKAEVISENKDVFNVYAAGMDWCIIPDFDMPDDYIASERLWYTGAVKSDGSAYVSPPYVDAMTQDICYTVSVILGDGDTVLAVDYTMDNIQAHIKSMNEEGLGYAVIVTDEGIIAGCSDSSFIGETLTAALPDYAGIYSLSKNSSGMQSVKLHSGMDSETLFAAPVGNGWYLIISEKNWDLYRDSYMQLLWTVIFSALLLAVIIFLYLRAAGSARKAEEALKAKEEFLNGITAELKDPLSKILEKSGRDALAGPGGAMGSGSTDGVEGTRTADVTGSAPVPADYAETLALIHSSGEKLSDMIGQIISYSNIVRTEKIEDAKADEIIADTGTSRHFRRVILILMSLVMFISLYTNMSATYKWGSELMKREADSYEYQFAEWVNTQKSILDMFASIISTHPEMIDDYEGTIDYLDRITKQYPEISVTYMSGPQLDPQVYMNNGWKPEPGWNVTERPWYIATMRDMEGWSISSPYYDDQTGAYCVTISEKVYDAETGEFLGIFGIDFFMDKLVEILGDSYSDDGYAFLVDNEGTIVNHPYGSYQMTQDHKTNVADLSYGRISKNGSNKGLIRDYDGNFRIMTAARSKDYHFTIYVVSSAWKMYGRVVVYGLICLITFLVCIALVYKLLSDLMATQDQTNRKMRAAADAAIAAGESKSKFLAQMSHEIRTPINAILGMNEMILRESEDEGILEYSGNIRSAGKTLLTIINSILDFSKIEDGKMEIIPVRYELAGMINNLVNSISERAKAKNLELVVNVDKMLPSELFGDDVRIEQVIMNLLTNAVKYTEAGTITFSVEEAGRIANSVIMEVSVKDTGIGIRKEDMGKLFESFERLEEKRNRNIEGTGLGMSIVTKLLNMMGSELKVDSVYGSGSTFSFRIKQDILNDEPIGDYTLRREQAERDSAEEKILYAPDAQVLVTDDNEMNLKVVFNLMKIHGFSPDLASSGEETIRKMATKDYDIVFLDHMMPKMDGLETMAKLKESGRALPPVIALTANAVVGARDMYIAAGFDGYISKPIDLKELQYTLGKYLPKGKVMYRNKNAQAAGAVPGSGSRTGAVPGSGSGTGAVPGGGSSVVPGGGSGMSTGGGAGTGGVKDPGRTVSSASKVEVLTDDDDEIFEFAPADDGAGTSSKTGGIGPGSVTDGTATDDDEVMDFSVSEPDPMYTHSVIKKLLLLGVSVKDGLAFCADNEALYIDMLNDFVQAHDTKKADLESFYESEDMKEYAVRIHALKSNSKTLGIMDMSKLAEELEGYARSGDLENVKKHHDTFTDVYDRKADNVANALGINR